MMRYVERCKALVEESPELLAPVVEALLAENTTFQKNEYQRDPDAGRELSPYHGGVVVYGVRPGEALSRSILWISTPCMTQTSRC